MALFGNLPGALGRPLGRTIGRLFKLLGRARVRVAQRNLELCFPELDTRGRAQLLQESFLSIGEGSYEFARAWWGRSRGLEVDHVEGLETLEALRQQGRGVLLLSGHFLTLEICGRLLCRHIELAGFYRRHEQPALEWAVKRGRARYAVAMFAREELRAAVKFVKQGGVLWYAPDQALGLRMSIFAPFYGTPARTITATARLSQMGRARVVPYFPQRLNGRYIIRILPALENFPSDDELADATRINQLIEHGISYAPTQYFWVHKRYKGPPAGQASVYARK